MKNSLRKRLKKLLHKYNFIRMNLIYADGIITGLYIYTSTISNIDIFEYYKLTDNITHLGLIYSRWEGKSHMCRLFEDEKYCKLITLDNSIFDQVVMPLLNDIRNLNRDTFKFKSHFHIHVTT